MPLSTLPNPAFLLSHLKFLAIRGNRRNFYGWLNIVFNRRDESRVKTMGPDRVAAEWILRNDGFIRFVGQNQWVTSYNAIPDGPPGKNLLEAIKGGKASLTNNGFDHLKQYHILGVMCVMRLQPLVSKNLSAFVIPSGRPGSSKSVTLFIGLKHLRYLDLNGSKYISDLTQVKEVADSLEYLDIGNCLRIADVSPILSLPNLRTLIITDTLGKGREAVIENLRTKLNSCQVIDKVPHGDESQ